MSVTGSDPQTEVASAQVAPAEDVAVPDGAAEAPDTRFRYTAELAAEIEGKWQDFWDENGTFHTPNPSGPLAPADPSTIPAEKMYVLDMFPYPSGAGLHVGHPLGYIGTDVIGRFERMRGRNVLHTLGYDSFGLPAEQYAVRNNTHPRATTEENVGRYRQQLRRLGFAHDPRRSVATTDVDFYRWTQWIFLQLFNSFYDTDARKARPIEELVAEFAADTREVPGGAVWSELSSTEQGNILAGFRLAYIAEAPVNWCPGLGTVLSNEEITADNKSEIGNFPVFRRNLRQWMMRITAYGDRLIEDLDRLDWPESIKSMQRNWIGRSTGARVSFAIEGSDEGIEVYTTRPDTLFGATYVVLAPEHPLVPVLTAAQWPAGTPDIWTGGSADPAAAVQGYRDTAGKKSDLERQENKEKTGVFTGSYAVNPVTGTSIPVFVADYVLMGYGTGAIMAVPGEDTRDWDFAKAYGLPYIRTVQPPADHPEDEVYTGDGVSINSSNEEISLDGLSVTEAKARITEWLVAKGSGRAEKQYRLRDWLFSRQRYWGEPFPIVYDEDNLPIALPEHLLPLELPEVANYAPQSFDPEDSQSTPVPPLGRATEWATVDLDLGDGVKTYRRELNVMPQWAGSCWYELRYLDPTNNKVFVDPEVEKYWMGKDPTKPGDTGGVDLYVGGVEHAVLHLLYARFWHKVLFDLGHVSSEEPFRKLFNQGYIQAFAYTDERGFYVPAEKVESHPDGTFTYEGKPVNREYGKMGKSLNNVVTPDEMCARYGADTFRIYEMGMGPLDISRPWQTQDAVGSQRYLQRLWRNIIDETTGEVIVTDDAPDAETLKLWHKTIDGVTGDLAGMLYNTAIAKLIVLNNHLTKSQTPAPRVVAEDLVLMTAPLAPHIAEELWNRLGHETSLAKGPFPVADPANLVESEVEYPIQVKGKVRSRITVAADATVAEIEAAALADEKIVELLAGVAPKKVVVVPGRMVSIVP